MAENIKSADIQNALYETISTIARKEVEEASSSQLILARIVGKDPYFDLYYTFRYENYDYHGYAITGVKYNVDDMVYILWGKSTEFKNLILANAKNPQLSGVDISGLSKGLKTISKIESFYILSATKNAKDLSKNEDDWSKEIPVPTKEKQYVFSFTKFTYSDGTFTKEEPILITSYATVFGRTLESITYSYGISDSQATQPTTWTENIPTVPQGKFLWTQTTENYSDGSNFSKYSFIYIPKDGEAGTKITKIEYGISDSTDTKPTTWQEQVPAAAAGKVLWKKITYSNGDVEYGYSAPGQQGEAGKAIREQYWQYYLSSKEDSLADGAWEQEVPSLKANTYIWRRLYTKWTDDTEAFGEPSLDTYHNNQYKRLTQLENNSESTNIIIKTQLGKIEKVENELATYKDMQSQFNTIVTQYNSTVQSFEKSVNDVKEVTGRITTTESGIKIEKPNDPSGLSNQLGSRGFEVTKPDGNGGQTTVLKADENGVYANSFKAESFIIFGNHRAEKFSFVTARTDQEIKGTGFFYLGGE